MVEPGRRSLGGRYELADLIAAGGMGQVWRGCDTLLGRPVAVKVLRSEYTADPTFRARFRAEAQHAAALSHPNIAAVFDFGETEAEDGSGEPLSYLVMELVEGEPLSAVLHRGDRFDAETTLSLLEQTASALAEAHRVGLVHRDVKPGNILVRADGSVKITDFGIAWSADSVPLTRTGQVIGTPQYLSPEVAEGHHATPASDVYALGLVGYECLTGHPAFDGDNAVTIALKQVREDPDPLPDDLPGDVRTLIRRALSKDPAVRMADGAAFVAAIEDVRAGRPQPEPPATQAVAVPPPPPAGSGEPPAGPPSLPTPRTDSTPAPHTISPPVHRRHGPAAVLVPLLTLLLGAGAAAGVFVAVNDGPSAPPQVAAQTQGAEILLDVTDYVGRPVDEVALALSALGLLVSRQEQVTPDSVPGLVTGLEPPGGALRPGDEVVVLYGVAPPVSRTPDRGSSPVTGAAGEGPSTVRPAPQEEQEAAPTTTVPAPDPTQLSGSAPPSSSAPTTTAPATTTTTTTAPTTTTTAPTTTTTTSSSTSEESRWQDQDDEDDDEEDRG
ncbi:protein kinase domain-containing protein [Geodermatophilus sp. SYSU D01105]